MEKRRHGFGGENEEYERPRFRMRTPEMPVRQWRGRDGRAVEPEEEGFVRVEVANETEDLMGYQGGGERELTSSDQVVVDENEDPAVEAGEVEFF